MQAPFFGVLESGWRYYIILDEVGVPPPDPESQRHFEHWGGKVPRELLRPWQSCTAFGQPLRCPAGLTEG
eukprot:s3436_g6.t1